MYIRVQIQLIISYQYAICLYSTVLDEDFHIKLPLKSVWEYAIFKIFLGGMPPDPWQ